MTATIKDGHRCFYTFIYTWNESPNLINWYRKPDSDEIQKLYRVFDILVETHCGYSWKTQQSSLFAWRGKNKLLIIVVLCWLKNFSVKGISEFSSLNEFWEKYYEEKIHKSSRWRHLKGTVNYDQGRIWKFWHKC